MQDGGRTPYWKPFSGNISAPYRPINAKFGLELHNHMPIQDTWPKLQFLQIEDDGRTAAILKIALYPYVSRELSDFDPVWYTDTNFHSEYGNFIKKMEIFEIQDGGRMPYWKSFFGYISVPYWPINANFGKEMRNHMQISVTWQKRQFSQIQHGGQPPFWK